MVLYYVKKKVMWCDHQAKVKIFLALLLDV